jgi:signal transduction histidine kinase
MAGRDRASWDGDAALYRLIVSNGVEATAARFVNLSQYDAASGLISGVVWAVSPIELAERALSLMRRLVPGFEIDMVSFPATANAHVARVHLDGRTVLAPFREIVDGTVHAGVALAARRVMGLTWTVSVPLRPEDVVVGSLAFHFTEKPSRRILRGAEAFARQVTLTLQNARLSAELGRRLDELQRSRRLVLAAEERTRREIAELLHGRVQNRLLMAWSRLGQSQELWASDPDRARDLLGEARAEIDEIREHEIRRAGYLLHPAFIREGLGPAVRELAGRFGDALEVSVEVEPSLERLDTPVRNALAEPLRLGAFRIVEEALINVLRHARARRAVVRLGLADDALTVEVRDDGVGFEPASVERGLGTANMAGRAAHLAGDCLIESAPGAGTTVRTRLPLESPAEGPGLGPE